MKLKSPLFSRYAAMLMLVAAAMHSLVALDLLFHFLPGTPEIRALWATTAMVKGLWVVFVVLGFTTVVLLYRAPLAGFLLAVVASVCLYFASVGLWQEVKGGFWIAIAATLLAAIGAWQARSNKSFKPNPLRGSA
jgi:hypothetical protein